MKSPERIAVIDLGTASIRFEVYMAETGRGIPKRIYRESHMTRLGRGLTPGGSLDALARDLTLSRFSDFQAVIKRHQPLTICAVATSALREASDGEVFLAELEALCGAKIAVISGEEEARLTAVGIRRFERNVPEEVVLVDIGGGSTEVSICLENRIVRSLSIPFGALRCHEQHLKQEIPPNRNSLDRLRAETFDSLTAVLGEKAYSVEQALGSSVTVRTLCAIRFPQVSASNSLSRTELQAVLDFMAPLNRDQLMEIEGMEEARVDIVLAGTAILTGVFDYFGCENIRATRFSLRHGLLAEALSS